MNGLKAAAETLPSGVERRELSGLHSFTVADRVLVKELLTILVEGSKKIELRAGVSSRLRLLLDYSPMKSAQENELQLELYLAPGACVDVFHVLDGQVKGTLTAKVRYHLKKHASLNVWTYVGAGDLSIFQQEALFEEEHAFASLRGLSVLGGEQQCIHKVHADHRVGHGISRQFYKSLVTDKAKSVFESLVSVARGAVRSDSKQLNKNLVLSASAECASRPELRIRTDDVSAAHGSATGQMDENELFYLRSRGIPERQARFMMMEGFAGEALEDIADASLKTALQVSAKRHIEGLQK